ncbi:hypothetical protein [Klebsiella pneumoniae]|uniref:hypothetical protein n=1 Tax=Klebsiella pneumoniae TaxID=573 RepID=UPI00292CDD53|nr:hypothetical protein [Klebsiella pneumoniae]
MASRASLSATRFLTSLRTAGTLKPTANPAAQKRLFRSFPGLLGATDLQPVAELMNPEETSNNTFFADFEESLRRWQNEAQMLRDIRLIPEDLELSKRIEEASREQLKDLLEAAEDEVLDIRQGWILSVNY